MKRMSDRQFEKRIDAEDPPDSTWLRAEARRARASEAAAIRALGMIQWSGVDTKGRMACPACTMQPETGHSQTCLIHAALTGAEQA